MPKLKEEWWHTDRKGRRIGWMTPESFQEWLGHMYPDGASERVQFAHSMGMDVSKVHRWLTGKDPIPKWVAVLHYLWMEAPLCADHLIPDASWLPYSYCVNGKQHPPAQNDEEQRGKHLRKAS